MPAIDDQLKSAEAEWMRMYEHGPKHTRWETLPLQVGDQAPNLTLLTSKGDDVQLSDFWQEKGALVLFWRHFGCSCGMDRARRLLEEYPDYERAGANTVIIGQGEPERSVQYAKRFKLEAFPFLCDPDYKAYFAYGLLEGKESQVLFDAPESLIDRQLEAGKEFVANRKADNRPLVDNPWLLPGEFVIDQNGIIRLAYRYNYCEDYPDHRVHLTAIRETQISVS